MSSLFEMPVIEVTEDTRTIEEVLRGVRKQWRVTQGNAENILANQPYTPEPGKSYRIGIVSQERLSTRPENMSHFVQLGRHTFGFEQFPFIAALLFMEQYKPAQLNCKSLVLAHYWVRLPRPEHPDKTRRFLLGITGDGWIVANRERREWLDEQAKLAFLMPPT